MGNKAAMIRKSDLAPAFEAAKTAGYESCTVTMQDADGRIFQITAGPASDSTTPTLTPLERWKADRAAS